MPTEKTALVLAGGGSLGAVQVGMLQTRVDANELATVQAAIQRAGIEANGLITVK